MTRELVTVDVRGTRLTCHVCGGDRFWHQRTLMNTRGMTLFKLDWANEEADCWTCGACGHVHWFRRG